MGGMRILTGREWVDKIHEITDALEHEAVENCDKYIRKAQSYRDGYIQACEDFGREMRRMISEERNKEE